MEKIKKINLVLCFAVLLLVALFAYALPSGEIALAEENNAGASTKYEYSGELMTESTPSGAGYEWVKNTDGTGVLTIAEGGLTINGNLLLMAVNSEIVLNGDLVINAEENRYGISYYVGVETDKEVTITISGSGNLVIDSKYTSDLTSAGILTDNIDIQNDGFVKIDVENSDGIYAKGDVSISCGDLDITSGGAGIYANGDVSISCGDLDITSGGVGIYANGDLKLYGSGTMNITAGSDSNNTNGVETQCGNLYINDSACLNITSYGEGILLNSDNTSPSITMSSNSKIKIDAMKNGIVSNGGDFKIVGDGNIDIECDAIGIEASENLTITGVNINIDVIDKELESQEDSQGIKVLKKLIIESGDIKISSYEYGIRCENFEMTGGNLDVAGEINPFEIEISEDTVDGSDVSVGIDKSNSKYENFNCEFDVFGSVGDVESLLTKDDFYTIISNASDPINYLGIFATSDEVWNVNDTDQAYFYDSIRISAPVASESTGIKIDPVYTVGGVKEPVETETPQPTETVAPTPQPTPQPTVAPTPTPVPAPEATQPPTETSSGWIIWAVLAVLILATGGYVAWKKSSKSK